MPLFFISPIALHAVVCFRRTTFGSFTTGFDEMALIKSIDSLFFKEQELLSKKEVAAFRDVLHLSLGFRTNRFGFPGKVQQSSIPSQNHYH